MQIETTKEKRREEKRKERKRRQEIREGKGKKEESERKEKIDWNAVFRGVFVWPIKRPRIQFQKKLHYHRRVITNVCIPPGVGALPENTINRF